MSSKYKRRPTYAFKVKDGVPVSILTQSEDDVQAAVVDYFGLRYAGHDAILHANYLSGVKLPMNIAVRAKRLGARKSMPDVMVFHGGAGGYRGLALELKRPGERLVQVRKEAWASEHVGEQALTLARLRRMGWYATFAIGFDHARAIIDWYMASYLSPIGNERASRGLEVRPSAEIVRQVREGLMVGMSIPRLAMTLSVSEAFVVSLRGTGCPSPPSETLA